jgi:hypothetical protein
MVGRGYQLSAGCLRLQKLLPIRDFEASSSDPKFFFVPAKFRENEIGPSLSLRRDGCATAAIDMAGKPQIQSATKIA